MYVREAGIVPQDHRWADKSSSSLPPSTHCLVKVLMNDGMTICLIQSETQKEKKNQSSLLLKIQVSVSPKDNPAENE
jgi:hypothetical protein